MTPPVPSNPSLIPTFSLCSCCPAPRAPSPHQSTSFPFLILSRPWLCFGIACQAEDLNSFPGGLFFCPYDCLQIISFHSTIPQLFFLCFVPRSLLASPYFGCHFTLLLPFPFFEQPGPLFHLTWNLCLLTFTVWPLIYSTFSSVYITFLHYQSLLPPC